MGACKIMAKYKYDENTGEALYDENTGEPILDTSADDLRAQAKAQYEQDVAAQRAQNVEEYKQAHPTISALLPRSAENAANDDRGFFGKSFDTAKDLTSLPGRVANAAIGFGAERAAHLAYGPRDQETQMQLAAESALEARKRTGEYIAPSETNAISGFAQNLLTDPYALPMIAVGGPIASKIAGSGMSTAAKVLSGIGADAALNTAVGALERGTSKNPEEHALDAGKMAFDATLGGAFSGLMHGIGGISGKLQRSGKAAIGNDVIGSTPLKKREDLISNWSESGRADSPADRQSAALAIGDELLTGKKVTTVKAEDGYPTTQIESPTDLPLGFTKAKEKILENQLLKQKEAGKDLDALYGDLDYAYHSDVQRMKEHPEQVKGIDAFGNPVHEVNLHESGVPIEKLIQEAQIAIGRNTNSAIDAKAIQDAGLELSNRLRRIESEQGTISPSAARDLKKRLYSEIRDNPKSMDLDEFYQKLYNNINDHISGMEAKRLGANVPEGAEQAYGSLTRAMNFETPFASQNAEVRRAMQLGEGLERSKFFNPSQQQTPFGETMDILSLGAKLNNPALLAVEGVKGPIARVQMGRALAGTTEPQAMQVSRLASRAVSSPSAEKQRLDAASRNMTEMEYRALNAMLAKSRSARTPEEVQALKRYGIIK
jgi:hypothetical protein